jgi:competence protein ComEC
MRNNLILFLCFIFCAAAHYFFIRYGELKVSQPDSKKNMALRGTIDSVPVQKSHAMRFEFHVNQLNHQKISSEFLMTWYGHPPQLSAGQRWQLQARVKSSRDAPHFKHFNYALYLLAQGIAATGTVIDRHAYYLGENHRYFLTMIREKIEKNILRIVHDPTSAAWVSALCVGLRDGLTSADWQVLQKTGTNHLVAIAGLHIGFVLSALYFLTKRVMQLFPRLMLRIPVSYAAQWVGLFGALVYAVLSGFAIPAQRASLMLFCLLLSQLFCRRIFVWRRWWFAFGIIVISNPYNLTQASFWLSFMSIAVLIVVMSGRLGTSSHWKSAIKMQLTILIGLVPLMLWFFQQISLVALFANALAIPYVGFVMLPLVLLASGFFACHGYWVSNALFWLSGKAAGVLWHGLLFFASLPFSSWHHVIVNPIILIVGMIGCFYALMPQGFPAKWVGAVGLLPLFLHVSLGCTL